MIETVIARCPEVNVFDDYAEAAITVFPNGPDGKVPDWNPPPPYLRGPQLSFVLKNPSTKPSDLFLEPYGSALSLAYFAFGGYSMGATSDGTDSIPASHRHGVYMHFVALDDSFFEEIFPKMFDTTDKENFPGYLGANHVTSFVRVNGKRRVLTNGIRKNETRSEAVYRTKLLKHLEWIKHAVDPDRMLSCEFCTSDNRGHCRK
ncbi:hypothetical protein ACHAWF_002219 [Thalassiosira exigua]